jgi:hypothetical protein
MWRRAAFPMAVVLLALVPVPAQAAGRGAFVVDCKYSHSLQVDPIVAPGVTPYGHLHDFFGNRSTNADSTEESMGDASTTCDDWDDTAGYWSPAGYLNGAQLSPVRQRIYYFGEPGRSVQTIPPGLKVVAGNHDATSSADNPTVTWNCGGPTPPSSHPYDCTPYQGSANQTVDGVVGYVDFPQCWDGTHLDSADHMSHMAYETADGCPAGYPVYLPRLRLRVHYGIWDPCAGARPCGPADPDTNVAFSLSSGPYYTLHADFWNTWKQSALDTLVAGCLNAHVACGSPDPVTPSAPVLAASVGDGVVHLSWSPPASGGTISGYEVYRGLVPNGETEIASVDAATTTYDDTQVSNGGTYYYTVSAGNSFGEGQWSQEVVVTPGAVTTPGAPTLAASTTAAGTIKLRWTPPATDGGSAITGYRVYRGRSAGTETLLTTLGNVTLYRDSSAKRGVNFYRVSALNVAGEGPLSNEVSARPG